MKIIYKDGTVAECPQEEELHVIRHTAAHIMAQAIKHLFPEADFAYGPATQNGFYYDVDLGDRKLTPERITASRTMMPALQKSCFSWFSKVSPSVSAIFSLQRSM